MNQKRASRILTTCSRRDVSPGKLPDGTDETVALSRKSVTRSSCSARAPNSPGYLHSMRTTTNRRRRPRFVSSTVTSKVSGFISEVNVTHLRARNEQPPIRRHSARTAATRNTFIVNIVHEKKGAKCRGLIATCRSSRGERNA